MAIDITVPSAGESITEVVVLEWLVPVGGWVNQDEPVVTIETDKANIEVPAPISGTVTNVLKSDGEDAQVGETIGAMEAGEKPAKSGNGERNDSADGNGAEAARVMPAAKRALAEAGLSAGDVKATGPGGRLLKEDVQRHAENVSGKPEIPAASAPAPSVKTPSAPTGARTEEAVPMTRIRRLIAKRLLGAQQSMALLTTFNEVDMSAVMALRKQYKEAFIQKHGIKLGFMSFFVKACVEALKAFPNLNAAIDDKNQTILYHNYTDIGVAVGGGKGLVVPVIRNAERLGFGDIENTIADFGARAKTGKIQLQEMQGGTFTISNGGVYGSMLSTPIVNPPQSGILGMHQIKERPMAVDGQVVVRPMMYLALTYDHRIVDGREAVSFLVRVKDCLENPARILLDI
jgi:2-oxoglutarate dehydrogenase E2 component (dihydrolipoamide succinyltransferase)